MFAMERPLKLEAMAFHATVRRIWQVSELPQLLVDQVDPGMRNTLSVREKHRKTSYYVKHMTVNSLNLPMSIKQKIAVGVSSLDAEVLEFAEEMASNLRCTTRPYLDACCGHITFNQENYINKRITLSKVMRDYLVHIEYDSKAEHDYPTVECILTNVMSPRPRLSVIPSKHFCHKIHEVFCGENYWIQAWIRSLDSNGDDWNISQYQFAGVSKNCRVIRYYSCVMGRNHELLDMPDVWKYSIYNRFFGADVLAYWYHNVDRESLALMVLRNFDPIFDALLGSWRYRHMAIPFYEMVSSSLLFENFKNIFESVSFHRVSVCKHEYREIAINILLRIWQMTPINFREHPQIVFYVIPHLVNKYNDYDTFVTLISDFSEEMRERAFAHMLLFLAARKKDQLLLQFVETVEQSGLLKKQHYKSYITKKTVRTFLLHSIESNGAYCLEHFRKALEFAFEGQVAAQIKCDLMHDEKFLLQICRKITCQWYCYCDVITELIKWCLSGLTRAKREFMIHYIKTRYLNNVFKGLLLDVDKALDSAICFNLFNEPYSEIAQQSLSFDQEFMRSLFKNMVTYNHFHLLGAYTAPLFNNNLRRLMQSVDSFILSDAGVEAVIGMITYLDNVEEQSALRFNFAAHVSKYISFKNMWLIPYSLTEALDEKLVEYGHPNLKIKNEDIKLKGKYDLTPAELPIARRYIDVNYRIFRAILRGYFNTVLSLHHFNNADLTRASIYFAGEVDLYNIDVVV